MWCARILVIARKYIYGEGKIRASAIRKVDEGTSLRYCSGSEACGPMSFMNNVLGSMGKARGGMCCTSNSSQS